MRSYVIELVGPKGVGKSYYCQELQKKTNYKCIKNIEVKKITKFYYVLISLFYLKILRIYPKHYLKALKHLVFIHKYRKNITKKVDFYVSDQGIIFQINRLSKISCYSFDELLELFSNRFKFPLPDIAVFLVADSETVLKRRKKRNEIKDANINIDNYLYRDKVRSILYESKTLHQFILVEEYFSKHDDSNIFIKFITSIRKLNS